MVENFYQTSLFFPMPTVVICTLCEDSSTTLGPYSLCRPYYIAGKDYYAMQLCCRNSSNTAQNILRCGKCAINFMDDKPGMLDGYDPLYHDFNGITSKFGAHFILRADRS